MDGIAFLDLSKYSPSRGRGARRWGDQARNTLLVAFIVVVTFATLLLLDYAGIHLPTAGEWMAVP